jgi:hypothetical protein
MLSFHGSLNKEEFQAIPQSLELLPDYDDYSNLSLQTAFVFEQVFIKNHQLR